MSTGQLESVVRRIRSIGCDGMTDGQLLDSFLLQKNEAAFEALVRRHGPMVLTVCRRVLKNRHDADDAFQATFFVLVRKAATIGKRELLGNWLYGVAYRTAMKARTATARRRAKETQMKDMPQQDTLAEGIPDDLLSRLDEELNRLPEKYRVPIVLCDLQGTARKEAARKLRWPIGTLNWRLARARTILAERLKRHGFALSGGALATALTRNVASATVPTSLVTPTVKAGMLLATGTALTSAVTSAKVAALTEGVVKTMFLSKLKIGVPMVLAIALLVGGVSFQSYRLLAAAQSDAQEEAEDSSDAKEGTESEQVADLAWDRLGLKLQLVGSSEVVSQAKRQLEGGMKVLAVRSDSPAFKEGVKRGDVLVGLHDWQTSTRDSVPFTLGYCQGKEMKTVRFVLLRESEIIKGVFALEPDVGSKDASLRLKKLGDAKIEEPSADHIRWGKDYNSARRESLSKKLPLCLYFTTEGCSWSSRMEATTFRNPKVITLVNDHFVPIRVDGRSTLAEYLRVETFPTMVIASPKGNILGKIEGYKDAEGLVRKLVEMKPALGEDADKAKKAVLAAFRRFCKAVKSEDLRALNDCSITVSGDLAALRDATARCSVAQHGLYRIAAAKFGKDAEQLMADHWQDPFLDAWITGQGKAKVQLTGDRAIIEVSAEFPFTMQCRRESKSWKIDFAICGDFEKEQPEEIKKASLGLEEDARGLLAIAAEIEQGSLNTLKEVKQAIGTRLPPRSVGSAIKPDEEQP